MSTKSRKQAMKALSTSYDRERAKFERGEYRSAFANKLPYADFTDDLMPLTLGERVGVGFALYPVAGDALTNSQYNLLMGASRTLLCNLPDNIEVQFICERSDATEADVLDRLGPSEATGNPDLDAFERLRRRFVLDNAKRGRLAETRFYAYFLFPPSPRWRANKAYKEPLAKKFSDWLTNLSGHSFKQRALDSHRKMVEDVNRQAAGVVAALANCGVVARRLTDAENRRLVRRYLNPRRRDLPDARFDKSYRDAPRDPAYYDAFPDERPYTPRDQMVSTDVADHGAHLVASDGGQVYIRTLNMKMLPENTVPGMIEQLTSTLDFPFWLSLNLRIPPKSEELKRLRRELRMEESIAATNILGHQPDSSNARVRARQLRQILEETIEGTERPLYASLLVRLEAPTEVELDERCHRVVVASAAMEQLELMTDCHSQRRMWLAAAPANSPTDFRKTWASVWVASVLMPVIGHWRGTPGAPLVCFPNRNRELVAIDHFASTAGRNFSIIGGTGSGKSVFAGTQMVQHMRKPNGIVYVLDNTGTPALSQDGRTGLGNSAGCYEAMTKAFGGQYVPVEIDKLPNMNPLAIRMPAEELAGIKCNEEGVPLAAISTASAFIESLALEPGQQGLSKPMQGMIRHLLKQLYIRFPYWQDPPYLDNFVEELQKVKSHPVARALLDSLMDVAEDGPFGAYLNDRDAPLFEATSRFIVFDLAGLSSFNDYAPSAVMMVTNFLDRQMMRASLRSHEKMMQLDECFNYLTGPMGKAAGYYFATARKFNGMIGVTSQDLSDIENSPVGARIIQNTAIKYVLKLNGRHEETCRAYGLTVRDRDLIESLSVSRDGTGLEYREVFVRFDQMRTVLEVHVDAAMYYLLTSDPRDKRLLRAMERVIGVPGRDLTHFDFYCEVASRFPKGTAQRIDLARLEADVARAHSAAA